MAVFRNRHLSESWAFAVLLFAEHTSRQMVDGLSAAGASRVSDRPISTDESRQVGAMARTESVNRPRMANHGARLVDDRGRAARLRGATNAQRCLNSTEQQRSQPGASAARAIDLAIRAPNAQCVFWLESSSRVSDSAQPGCAAGPRRSSECVIQCHERSCVEKSRPRSLRRAARLKRADTTADESSHAIR